MRIVLIKYNSGNIMSVDFALKRLGIETVISDDPEVIGSADKVIFPGVGEAGTTMKYLVQHKLDVVIRNLKQPVLGICLGLQLMCSHSEEADTDCIGIFEEKVFKFIPDQRQEGRIKVPHMGWNAIYDLKGELLSGLDSGSYAYFVHSYYASPGEHTVALCDYSVTFSAALQKDNFHATQFHPEKSGKFGAEILKKFLEL